MGVICKISLCTFTFWAFQKQKVVPLSADLSRALAVAIDCCCGPVLFPLTGLLHQLIKGIRLPAEILCCLIVCDLGPVREVLAFTG